MKTVFGYLALVLGAALIVALFLDFALLLRTGGYSWFWWQFNMPAGRPFVIAWPVAVILCLWLEEELP